MNEIVLWLVLGAIYLVLELVGRKRKQAAQQRQRELESVPMETAQPQDDPDLEEALRQIGEALGMPIPEKKPTPLPRPKPEAVETDFHGQVIVREERLPHQPKKPDFHEQSFEDRPPFQNRPIPQEDAFEKRPPYQNRPAPSEEAFEKLPPYSEQRNLPVRAQPKPLPVAYQQKRPLTQIAPPPPPSPTLPTGLTQKDIQRLLQDTKRAREAFVLSEVFGPPKSLRK